MNIYTYWEPVPGINLEDSYRLLMLWRKNWHAMGFNPVVLKERHAQEHTRFAEIDDRVRKFPTVNDPEYERHCYLRYLAMAHVGGGVMVDNDVFCYGEYPFPPNMNTTRKLVSLQGHIPSCVYGARGAYEAIIKEIYLYQVSIADVSEAGIPHVSDMYIFLRNKAMPYRSESIVKNFGDEGWKEAPLVHFSNGSMRGLSPRWKHIQQLRNWV